MVERLKTFHVPPFSGRDVPIRTWLIPIGLMPIGKTAFSENTVSFPLAGGPYGFTHLDVFIDDGAKLTVTRIAAETLMDHVPESGRDDAISGLERLTSPRPDYAGLEMIDAHVMGILNTTPDSFSDGGDHLAAERAISSGHEMIQNGAVILDIGGESTRPGAEPIGYDEECRRITPVITALSAAGYVVSADTRHTDVMATALDHDAMIINDVGGLRDEGAISLVSAKQTAVMIMHMQGSPGTMQSDPQYRFAPLDIYDWLERRILACEAAGLPRHLIAIDPGFGFGKTPHHNMQIMAHLALFHGLGVPIVLGVSRKSAIAHFSRREVTSDRMPGSIAMAVMARAQGVQIFRVHDVAETVQALASADALLSRRS